MIEGMKALTKQLRRPLVVGVGIAVSLAVLTGCGGNQGETQRQPRAATALQSPRPVPELPPSAVALCHEAVTGSSPNWRQDATTAGSFGLSGPGRDFHWSGVERLKNGQYLSKIPAVVNGKAPVVLRVPEGERGRVGLDYGDFRTAHSIHDAHAAVIFRPCRNQPNTGWPGGLVLKNRRPITLEVETGGGPTRSLQIGTD
jgi:hypothetical protein